MNETVKIKDRIEAKYGRRVRKVIDQIAHFTWTFLALIPVLMLDDHTIGAGLSALLFVLPREFGDQWPVGNWPDTLLDLAFFTLGGVVIGNFF